MQTNNLAGLADLDFFQCLIGSSSLYHDLSGHLAADCHTRVLNVNNDISAHGGDDLHGGTGYKAEVFEVSTDFRFSAYLLDDVFFALCGK